MTDYNHRSTLGRDESGITRVDEPSSPNMASGLHGSSDVLGLAMGLEQIQDSLVHGVHRPRYELRSELGVGGQGLVFSVYDRDFGRSQAVKVLHEHRSNQDGIARFVHEAQVMAQLEHPGVVPIHDLNVLADGTLYYSMKRIDGQSLGELIPSLTKGDQRFRALEIYLKVCETISFAHDKGVIHRDLKPNNIMVGAYGEVLVVDWGLAKTLGGSEIISPRDANETGDAFATRVGVAVGTPSYMSPEQAQGIAADVDQASDIFALGVILYELTVGYSPYFPATAARPVMEAAARGRWRDIHDIHDVQIAPALRAIIAKAMAYEKADRYPSVEALADDVRRYIAGYGVSAYRESPLETLCRWGKRHRTPLLAIAMTVIIGILLASASWWRGQIIVEQRVGDLRREAALAIARNQLTEAVANYQRLLELRPEDAEAAQGIGRYGALAERRVAERSAEAMRQRNLQRVQELREEAALVLADHPELAVERLTQALALLPAGVDQQREDLLLSRDQAQRRISERQALAEQAQAQDLLRRAERLADSEEWIEARVALQQALQLMPASETSAAIEQRVSSGLASLELRQRREAGQRLLGEAQAFRDAGNLAHAIASVQAAVALDQVEAGTELLGQLLREQDQQLAAERQARVLAETDREMAQVENALQSGDLATARIHLLRLQGINEEHPELGRLRQVDSYRTRLADAEQRQREQRAMEEIELVQGFLAEAATMFEQVSAKQSALAVLEDQLQQGAGDNNLRLQAHTQAQGIQRLQEEQSRILAEAVVHLNHALSVAPDYPPVRAVVAGFWAQRVIELERSGDAPAAAAAVAQGRHYDNDGRHRLVFDGLSIVTSACKRPISLLRIETQANRRDEPVGKAMTLAPGKSLEVPHGRWLLRAGDGSHLYQARLFQRGSEYTLRFPQPDRAVPEFMALIPESPLYTISESTRTVMAQSANQQRMVPAFYLARYEVTCGEYLEFINDSSTLRTIQRSDGPLLSLVPRAAWDSSSSIWLFENGRFHLRRAADREPISEKLPITGISRQDVDAYLRWRSQRDGLAWRLPTGDEWQVAAQGGDGRRFPWGSLHDAALCYSYLAAPTSSGWVERPVGSFSGDRSVHGIYDLAGSVAEFVNESWFDDPGVSVARGGSFADREAQRFSAYSRRAVDNRLPLNSVGFRLALDVP